jgi:hypothetical protein
MRDVIAMELATMPMIVGVAPIDWVNFPMRTLHISNPMDSNE